jgi:two-component system nitrate/nitrite sensor histidine kinase NarX
VSETDGVKALSPGDLGIGRLFEQVRDAVVVADATRGLVVLWNPAAERMFGYSAAEAEGLLVEELVPLHLKPEHRAGLARYSATGHGRILDAGVVVEVPAVCKSGEHITVELSLNPIRDAPVSGRFVLAIIRDVSERVELRAEAARRLRELEALYAADETLHRSLQLSDVLRALVDLATEIFEADKTSVLVWDERHERLVPGATRGFRPESVGRMSHALGTGITGQVALTRQPIAVEDAASDPRVVHDITDPEGIRSLLHVPIQVDGEVFGVFGVNYCQLHLFTGSEERLLVALAERAGAAITNARQYQRAQYAATVDERQRLARELHDAVTQSLFAAGLNAKALPEVWAANPEEGRRCLEELQRLTWGALAEMRTVLVELRPAAITEMDLADLLGQLAQAATGRAPELSIRVSIHGQRQLPPEVQVVFYRVAQEALTNIVKHAGARHVNVGLSRLAEVVELTVTDDGRGFDALTIPAGHLGLGIMQERVDSIGGEFTIGNAIEGGTRLRVVWRDARPNGRPE